MLIVGTVTVHKEAVTVIGRGSVTVVVIGGKVTAGGVTVIAGTVTVGGVTVMGGAVTVGGVAVTMIVEGTVTVGRVAAGTALTAAMEARR